MILHRKVASASSAQFLPKSRKNCKNTDTDCDFGWKPVICQFSLVISTSMRSYGHEHDKDEQQHCNNHIELAV